MNGPRLGALSNNTWSEGTVLLQKRTHRQWGLGSMSTLIIFSCSTPSSRIIPLSPTLNSHLQCPTSTEFLLHALPLSSTWWIKETDVQTLAPFRLVRDVQKVFVLFCALLERHRLEVSKAIDFFFAHLGFDFGFLTKPHKKKWKWRATRKNHRIKKTSLSHRHYSQWAADRMTLTWRCRISVNLDTSAPAVTRDNGKQSYWESSWHQ